LHLSLIPRNSHLFIGPSEPYLHFFPPPPSGLRLFLMRRKPPTPLGAPTFLLWPFVFFFLSPLFVFSPKRIFAARFLCFIIFFSFSPFRNLGLLMLASPLDLGEFGPPFRQLPFSSRFFDLFSHICYPVSALRFGAVQVFVFFLVPPPAFGTSAILHFACLISCKFFDPGPPLECWQLVPLILFVSIPCLGAYFQSGFWNSLSFIEPLGLCGPPAYPSFSQGSPKKFCGIVPLSPIIFSLLFFPMGFGGRFSWKWPSAVGSSDFSC